MLSNFRDAKSALPSSFNAREFILATCSGILLFSSVLPGLAQDGQKQQNTNGRRIAMVLPKAQASLKVVVAEPKPVKAAHLQIGRAHV